MALFNGKWRWPGAGTGLACMRPGSMPSPGKIHIDVVGLVTHPVTSALGRLRKGDPHEAEVGRGYIMHSRLAWVT